MKFNKIVCLDFTNLSKKVLVELNNYAEEVVIYNSDPKEDEIINRIGDAECILLSWRTTISKKIIENTNLKYIGMCSTSIDKIDPIAKIKGITVTNVSNYCDLATAEYVFSQLLELFRGMNKYKLDTQPRELYDKTLGIIGLGEIGKIIAKIAKGFGMNIIYHNRSKKTNSKYKYVTKDELIKTSDIITIHTTPYIKILEETDFKKIKEGTILVCTSLGKIIDTKGFENWIKNKKNFAIFDGTADKEIKKIIKEKPNVLFNDIIAGRSIEVTQRLSDSVISNIKQFLK
jgi:lactate dehydrogenase-like 2-hydroxyacid dehydrogenase